MTDPKGAGVPPKGKGERWKKALTALVSLAISLSVTEGAIRFIKRQVPFQPDPDLIRSLKPNVHAPIANLECDASMYGTSYDVPKKPIYKGDNDTNNIGFRMADDVGPKAADERRVLLLGDSFTEGDQVAGDKRFSALANDRLRAETANGPAHWRVLNGGIQNGAPSQYILELRRWLPLVQPDVVILNLAPNDVTDDLMFEQRYGYTFDADKNPLAPKSRTSLWLLQKSYLLRYFHYFLQHASPERGMNLFFPLESPDTKVIEFKRLMCAEDAEARQAFEAKTGKYVRKLEEMTKAAGARFGVMLVQYMWVFDDEPYYEPLFPTYKTEMAPCYASHGKPYDDYIEGFLQKNGIAYQNPHAALLRAKAEQPKRKLWHYLDYHYSVEGHRVVADELHSLVKRIIEPR
jgi:lysophospholipase L1-like esterase